MKNSIDVSQLAKSQIIAKSQIMHQSVDSFGRSIIVCLNPHCPVSQHRYLKGLKLTDHSDECKGHIFGIEALL
jgi:hypothetical protein